MAWINELKNPPRAKIITIKSTSKGLILYTAEYEAFLWANSKLAKDLKEALMVWSEPEHIGFELFIQPDKQKKLGFGIEMGKEHTIFVGENLWTYDKDELQGDNPFLVRSFKSEQHSPPNPFTREGARKGAKKVMEEFDSKNSTSAAEKPLEAS